MGYAKRISLPTKDTLFRKPVLIQGLSSSNNYIQVTKPIDAKTDELVWAFETPGDDKPLVLVEFIDEDRLLVVNWTGWIRVYSVSQKACVVDHNLDGKLATADAKLSEDKSRLYIKYAEKSKKENATQVIVIDTSDMNQMKAYAIPDTASRFIKKIEMSADARLLFYYCGEYRPTEYYHGYFVIDENSNHPSQLPLEHPQQEWMEKKEPVISPRHNLGVMPYWGDVEISQDDKGDEIFPYKLTLFDLIEFKVQKVIDVRTLSLSELACDEESSKSLVDNLKNYGKDLEGLYEAKNNFLSNLNSIQFHPELDEFWLVYRSGIVQKVSVDGNVFPPIKTKGHADLSTFQTHFRDFVNEVDSLGRTIRVKEIILEERGELYAMQIPENYGEEEQYEVEVSSRTYPELVKSEAQQLQEAEAGKVVIEIPDLENSKYCLEALEGIVLCTKHMDQVRKGNTLAFRVKDSTGRAEEDPEFFKRVISLKGADKKIVKALKNFMEYAEADRLYYDGETVAFAYAAYQLLQIGKKHLKTIVQYIAVIDFEHDVFCRETLLPEIHEKYDTKYRKKILKWLDKPADNGWKGFYLDELCD